MAHISIMQNDGTEVTVQDELECANELRAIALGLLERIK